MELPFSSLSMSQMLEVSVIPSNLQRSIYSGGENIFL